MFVLYSLLSKKQVNRGTSLKATTQINYSADGYFSAERKFVLRISNPGFMFNLAAIDELIDFVILDIKFVPM